MIPDYKFTELLHNNWYTFIKYACRLCKALSANRDLVQEGGGDCFPQWFFHWLRSNPDDKWTQECSGIKPPSFTTGKSQAKLMKMPSKDKKFGNYTYWMVMAFESVRDYSYALLLIRLPKGGIHCVTRQKNGDTERAQLSCDFSSLTL